MPDEYVARVVEVPDLGVRLEPTAGSVIPDNPYEVNLLALAVALAMGAAEYEHHPELRDTEVQTLEGLLAGTATMPWRAGRPAAAGAAEPYVLCEKSRSANWRCRVGPPPADPAAG
jgi:hypothetical protein